MYRRFAGVLAAAGAVVCFAAPAAMSASHMQVGFLDDSSTLYGDPDVTFPIFQKLRAQVVRVDLYWGGAKYAVAKRRPADAKDPDDPAYDWALYDRTVNYAAQYGIKLLFTLWATPRWANGGKAYRYAPKNFNDLRNFAYAAAKRYPFVRRWTVWNEPNQRLSLATPSPRLYVARLLNPAYVSIHRANRHALVAGGVTAPRGNTGGVGPLAWIRGMKAAHAKIDAYAHNPYPTRPSIESPSKGACSTCDVISMANLDRLLAEVR